MKKSFPFHSKAQNLNISSLSDLYDRQKKLALSFNLSPNGALTMQIDCSRFK